MDIENALTLLASQFRLDFNLRPVVGVELEAYVNPQGQREPGEVAMEDFLPSLEYELRSQGIRLYDVLQERGDNQFEIALKEQRDIPTLLDTIERSCDIMRRQSAKQGLSCLMGAKPFRRLPGNGLHVHVSLLDRDGVNVFYKKNEHMSPPLKHAIGGLLKAMPESMAVFAPLESSYLRFTGEEAEAPTNVSWGANNRTTALRLPDSADGLRHLEHRVPGMDAEPAYVIFVILAAMHYGISHKVEPPEQIYGNAFLPKYNLVPLPDSLEAAQELAGKGEVLAEYWEE